MDNLRCGRHMVDIKNSTCCIQDDPKRWLSRYHLIPLPILLLLTGVVICLYYLPIPNSYKPQFGGRAFCITTMNDTLVYCVFQVSVFVAMNMIFFLLTSMSLRKTFQRANNVHQSTPEGKTKYQVHLKPFILMGLTWMVGIVAPWANIPAVWFLFFILNSSQGIFIFFAFVFKSKCLRVLYGECCHYVTCDTTTDAEAGQLIIIEIQQLPSCTQLI